MVSELFVTREVIVSCPALLIADDPACQRTLAALTMLDRQVIAAHQAGAMEITVVFSSERPKLTRATALGVNFNLTQDDPELHVPTLLIAANLAVQSEDLERVLKNRGRLFTPDRTALPCGVTSQWKGDVESSLPKQPRTIARGVARMVKDGLSAAQAEDAIWDTMGLETDSFVDRNFNRPLGRVASKLLIHTRISPDQVSVLATLVGVFAAWCFTRGLPHWMILGAILLQLSAVIDCVDGDIARMLHKESAAGKWLDLGGDQLVHLCLFAGIGVGLHQMNNASGPTLWLGLVAALGVVLSFITILREEQATTPHPRLRQLMAKSANRDYSVILLGLSIVNRVEWFLWMAVLAVHCFWMVGAWLRHKDELNAEADA
jgi:phosphatidylglycerophosphate synthase